jgi:hypothetical protein
MNRESRSRRVEFGVYLRVVLEVEENSVPSPPRLPLSDDNGRHDLLPEFGLTLLDGTVSREKQHF